MDFCENCFNLLFTKEIIEDKKKLIYYCKKCNFKKDCINNLIFKTKYKNININNQNDNIEYNKIKINDDTLPSVLIKCNHCKKKNNNKYEIKYYDNSYHKHIICIKCYKYINS